MYSSLLDLVRELNTLNDDNLADRVITNSDVQWCLSELQDILEAEQPTITPPNEWVSVDERLPEPGDLIVYADNTVWGYQYGICRVCGKEKAFDYWIPLQDPPNNRPPEVGKA